ncbi:MAG: ABC transporter substrate-binding protein [Candidatus Thorarchaeota archaeon]
MRRSNTGIRRRLVTFVLIYCIICTGTISSVEGQNDSARNDWTGPNLDRIRYTLFNGSYPGAGGDAHRAEVLALIDGEIDAITTTVHYTEDMVTILETANIELVQFYRTAAFDLRFNCEYWPLNITEFRRAIHYAVDKETLCSLQDMLPQDSQIIPPHPFSIENEMEHHYYQPEIAEGAALLDSIEFIDIDHDGVREAPNGEELAPIEVKFMRIPAAGPLAEQAADAVVEALHNLNISAFSSRVYDTSEAWQEYSSGNYMMYTGWTHSWEFNLESWIRDWGPSNLKKWSNATFNAYADVARSSMDFNEITNAVKQMQHIMIEECPNIVLMQIPLFTAYRSDCHENFTEHPCGGSYTFFTGLSACNITVNSTGGCLNFGMSSDIIEVPTHVSPNPSAYWWLSDENLMGMMHDSLCQIDPNLNVIDWLLEDVTIECHDDDSTIPEGHTRISLDIVDNAKWSDGNPIIMNDVSFSINWYRENMPYTSDTLSNLIYCMAKTPDLLVMEFNTQTFWNWYRVCFLPILPSHATSQYALDPIEKKMSPVVFDESLIVSGPFMASEQVKGKYFEIVQNPYYWKNPKNIPQEVNDTNNTTPPPVDLTLSLTVGAIGAASIILVGGIVITRKYN